MRFCRIFLLILFSVAFLLGCSRGFELKSPSSSSNSSQEQGPNPDQPGGPSDPGGEPPPPNEPPPTEDPPPTEPPPPPSFEIFRDVAKYEGERIDQQFQVHSELRKSRRETNMRVDSCQPALINNDSFSDAIAFYVHEQTRSSKAKLRNIASIYKLPDQEADMFPTSLISHEMCRVTAQSLSQTIGSKRVPSASVIKKLNQFVDTYNQARTEYLQGSVGAELKLNRLWGRLFMCLAYTESLTTADTSQSERVASKHAPRGYQKPSGVKFYEDPFQSGASVLNIGLFQFSPAASGNIHPCVLAWNERHPQCSLETNGNKGYFVGVLGSGQQGFNAYCGVNKVQQMFSVQINTRSRNHTHPANVSSAGALKGAESRCVSLHFQPGASYTHFGPFLNSTGSNLGQLMGCVLEE